MNNTPRLARNLFTLILLASLSGKAASLTWDQGGLSPGSPNAATGTWDTSNAYWSDGSTDSIWNNSQNDTAVFTGGTNYTVTLDTPVTVGGIEFNTTTGVSVLVTLQSSTLTLAGGTATTIKVTDVNALATISSAITGSSGLTKTGSGGLQLSSTANNYTGTTTLSGGSLRIGVDNGLSTASALVMTSGTLEMQGHSQTVKALTGATGNTIRNRAAGTSLLTVNGSSSTTYAGSLTDQSTNQNQLLALKTDGSGQLTLTHTSGLTFHGATTISGTSTLKLNAGANLVNTSSVNITGGTLTSASGNINLGVGAVSMSAGAITPAGIGTAGTFTVAANQNFISTGGTLNFDLLSASSFDQIKGSGTGLFSLSDTTLALSGSYTSVAGTYQLFSGFGGSSSVSNLTITGLGSGLTASLDSTGLLTIATTIPEPSVFAATVGIAVLGLAACRRRRCTGR